MRRPFLIPLVLALVVGAAWGAPTPDSAQANGCPLRFTQGTAGTADDPIRISDRDALSTLATSFACYDSAYVYRQTADIDLTGVAWSPIAASGAFRGTYDGGGHRITGLAVSVSSGAAGLFSQVQGGAVRDLAIIGPQVRNTDPFAPSGALVGSVFGATVERVRVEGGTVSGVLWTGGLVGQICSGTLARGSSTAVVSGANATGGLVGDASSVCVTSAGGVAVSVAPQATVISDSAASGAVSGEATVGGLIGQMDGTRVERSAATGTAIATSTGAGGIVGRAYGISGIATPAPSDPTALVDVYATGAVSAAEGAGGLVGLAESGIMITRGYAIGRVTGGAGTGGVVGGELVGCASIGISICAVGATVASTGTPTAFWDSATTGQATSWGSFGTAKSTVDMQALGTYTAAGWPMVRGFSTAAGTTWGICPTANGGYPFLQGRYDAATQPCAGTPGKPSSVTMTSRDGAVTLSWKPPTTGDGGSPVTGYTATATMQRQTGRAGRSCTVAATRRSCTITGLVNGRAYRIALAADNLEGGGTPAVRTVTPRRSMTVLSTTRSGLVVVTRLRVRAAGRLTQVGGIAGLGASACRASMAVRTAGVVDLRCALSAAARAALADRDLAVRVVTRFAPAAGERRSAVRRVVFARIAGAGAVTG